MKALLWLVVMLGPGRRTSALTDECFRSTSKPYMAEDIHMICPEELPKELGPADFVCSEWCENLPMKPEVKDNVTGNVWIPMAPSPQGCNHTQFDISLYVVDVDQASCETGSFNEHSFAKHSEYDIHIGRNSTSCHNEITLPVHYAFTGCYQFKITPYSGDSSHQQCSTKPFFIRTNYIFTPITKPIWMALNNDDRHRITMIFPSNGSLHTIYTVMVRLYNVSVSSVTPFSCCTIDGLPLMHMIPKAQHSDKLGGHSYLTEAHSKKSEMILFEKIHGVENNCNCMWAEIDSRSELKCYFHNLVDGNYSIIVKGFDPRCVTRTLWTDHPSPCLWKARQSFKVIKKSSYEETPKHSVWDKWMAYSIVASVFIVLLGFIGVLLLVYKHEKISRYWNRNFYVEITKVKPMYQGEKTRLVLLYPRDCQEFMSAMEALRILLESTGKFEVFDALDPSRYEEVALNINTWGLKYFSDPSTKVILAASWCSRKFYDALLLDTDRLSYTEPQPFDSLFSLHLNHLFIQDQPYKKIYVIRLDCDKSETLWFEYIVQSRNFTLPQCTKPLLNQLLELSPEQEITFKDDQENVITKLQDAIRKYSVFMRENPDYLNTLIKDNMKNNEQILDYTIV